MNIVNICKNKRNRIIIVLIMIIAVVLLGLYIIAMDKIFNTGFKCPFHYILHLDCPGCGGSRMLLALLELRLYQAFRYNPFMLVTLPMISLIFIHQSYKFIKYNILDKHLDKILIVYVICVILFGVVRNIPGFEWLLPTDIK